MMDSTILWGIALLTGSYFIGRHEASKSFGKKIEKLEEAVIHRSQQILANFRRELSDALISADPARFQELFEWAKRFEEFVIGLSLEEAKRELSKITRNFEFLSREEEEFYETMNSSGYEFHSDNFSIHNMTSIEDLEQRYCDLIRFMALSHKIDPRTRCRFLPIRDSDLQNVKKYLQELHDAKFAKCVLAAMEEFDRNPDRRLDGSDGTQKIFDSSDFMIFYVHDYVAHRCFGIQFKDTLECGIYKKYLFDDSETPPREEVFRCDSNFENEKILYYPGSARRLRKLIIRTAA